MGNHVGVSGRLLQRDDVPEPLELRNEAAGCLSGSSRVK